MIFIYGKDKEDYLTGAAPPPNETDPTYRTWKFEKNTIMPWLLNSITNEISENFM